MRIMSSIKLFATAIFIGVLIMSPAAAQSKFHEWKVTASAPAGNPPLCELSLDKGAYSFHVWMYVGTEQYLGMDIREQNSVWRNLTGKNWTSLAWDKTIIFELDGHRWSVPITYSGDNGRISLTPQSPNEEKIDLKGDTTGWAFAAMRENSRYVRKLLDFIAQQQNMTIRDETGKKELVRYSLLGFADAYQAFNACVQNGGRL